MLSPRTGPAVGAPRVTITGESFISVTAGVAAKRVPLIGTPTAE
jgi:hypothetical protein